MKRRSLTVALAVLLCAVALAPVSIGTGIIADAQETGAEETAAQATGGSEDKTDTPEALKAAAAIYKTAEEIADGVKRDASDPAKSDVIVTKKGRRLSREDGNWIVPANEPASEDELTILYAGDIIFDASQNPGITKAAGGGIRACFDDDAWELMQNADLFVINNEFPYTNRGSALTGKTFTFRCDPDTVNWLEEMGVDVAALANNHIYDYGREGAMDTFDTLDEAGVPYIGAGRNLDEATRTAYYIADGVTVALLNATEIERYENPETRGATEDSPGVFRCLNTDLICQKTEEAAEHADFVIVYVHWGTELQAAADSDQERIAQDLQKAGADLVIGSHPHVLQNIEYIDGMPVFYSLGNYFFSAATRDNGVLKITLDTESCEIGSLQFIPMSQEHGVRTLSGSEKARVLNAMRAVSPGVILDEDGNISQSAGGTSD